MGFTNLPEVQPTDQLEKEPNPSPTNSFIGASLDSVAAQIFLPEDKALSMKHMAEQFMFNCFQKVITIQRLLGLVTSAVFMVPFAHLKMGLRQNWFI